MTATVAPSFWPAPAASRWRDGITLGREVVLSAQPGAARATRWLLRRNCSLTPRQLLAAYGLLCMVSLTVAVFFLLNGAPVVLGFTCAELLLVGAAMGMCARHAGDRETLTLVGRSLLVERTIATRTERVSFAADWLTVEPVAAQNSLVELAGQGQTMRVGRFLRPELRADLARELRRAVRRALAGHPGQEPKSHR